jgi:hypothetical protein
MRNRCKKQRHEGKSKKNIIIKETRIKNASVLAKRLKIITVSTKKQSRFPQGKFFFLDVAFNFEELFVPFISRSTFISPSDDWQFSWGLFSQLFSCSLTERFAFKSKQYSSLYNQLKAWNLWNFMDFWQVKCSGELCSDVTLKNLWTLQQSAQLKDDFDDSETKR